MNIIFASLLCLSLSLFSLPGKASAVKPKPGQVSTNCYYNQGPKAGQEESLEGKIKPVLIGKPCADGQGNSGIAMIAKEDEEAEEAEEAGKAAALAAKKTAAENSVILSSICQFNKGPRAGQMENYQGKIQPMPLGSACTDGLRSVGVIVAE